MRCGLYMADGQKETPKSEVGEPRQMYELQSFFGRWSEVRTPVIPPKIGVFEFLTKVLEILHERDLRTHMDKSRIIS